MTSPKTEQLDINLWSYDQLNNQVSGQMGAAIRQQLMLVARHEMSEQICSQMDDHTLHEMEDIGTNERI